MRNSTPQAPEPGQVLTADFWPEPVRVVATQRIGARIKLEVVGTRTQQFYSTILGEAELEKVSYAAVATRDFKGNPENFFLGIEAHRIRYAHQFDPLLAVNISQVEPLPHQIEAVYHYILRNPRIRFLLADDPGAGKTIMTGLLLKELKYRGLVRRILIVVPGHLKDQWLREMKERFGETFTVIDRAVIDATWGRNVWAEQSQVITSMDFAKQDDVMAALAEVRWDIVVVDEAHKMAAYRYGDKTAKTDRYRLGELLSRTTQFLLFLTATPHRGDPENFRLFLDLLEPGMFANQAMLLESIQHQDNPLFLRRLKEDLRDFDGRVLFPPRHVFTRTFRLNDAEKRLYNAVTTYVEESYNKALEADKRNVAFALLILQRRLASSVRAVRRSLERRKARLEELLSLGQWLARGGELDEEAFEDAPEAERLRREEEMVERLTAAETRQELEAEIQKLSELIQLARDAERNEIETKLNELREVMRAEKVWQTGEKLLVFTESRETLEYLVEKLKAWGYTVAALHGGMDLDARIRAEHEFREKAQVMVSTEAGGEGINLQFCSLMVNYDIPWNPNRLEQRMGRIHRYGQQKEVHVYNLVAADTREGRVMQALFDKLERIREAYGADRVFDVIGELIPGRNLKDLIVDAISQRRTLDEIVAEIQAVPDTEAIRKAREAALEALATRHIDLSRVLGDDRRAREQRLVPEYIERFFLRGCSLLNVPVEKRRDGLWRVPHVPYTLRAQPESFKHKFGEVFDQYQKLAFNKQAARRLEATFVAPGHPLLESIIERLFADCDPDLRRGAVFADPDGNLDGWLWFLEGELRDGTNQLAGKRIFAVYQPADGSPLRLINSSVLWDLKPCEPADRADTSNPPEQPVLAFAIDHVLEDYRAELSEQRQRTAAIKQKYGLRSLEQMILESDAKLIDYETRRAKGELIPEAEIRNEERRRDELCERKRALEDELRREVTLVPTEPRIIGVARVAPAPVPDRAMRPDRDIEAIGMRVALEFERSQNRQPEDVSLRNLGYDIRSEDPHGAVRYIEVKARAGTGAIVLTPNEWLMAQRLGQEYWLYVVEDAATEPKLFTLCNPAAKLEPEEVAEIVRYVVRDWRKHASHART